VGRSGTGKTTIAKHLFPDAYIRGFVYKEPSILDDFPEHLATTDITRALSSVGFSSPPEWLKSYEQLSQGEKMRALDLQAFQEAEKKKKKEAEVQAEKEADKK
jgi:hypothetical protein